MSLILRKGTKQDFEALYSLIREEAESEGSLQEVKNTFILMKKEESLIHFFLAELGGKPVGMAVYCFTYHTWVGKSLYIDDLYVHKEYRNKKIGTKLLFKIFETAQQEECHRLRFEVEEKNKDAQKFYKAVGTKIGDTWLNCDFNEEAIVTFLKTHQS